jgi:hypothetical protein
VVRKPNIDLTVRVGCVSRKKSMGKILLLHGSSGGLVGLWSPLPAARQLCTILAQLSETPSTQNHIGNISENYTRCTFPWQLNAAVFKQQLSSG